MSFPGAAAAFAGSPSTGGAACLSTAGSCAGGMSAFACQTAADDCLSDADCQGAGAQRRCVLQGSTRRCIDGCQLTP